MFNQTTSITFHTLFLIILLLLVLPLAACDTLASSTSAALDEPTESISIDPAAAPNYDTSNIVQAAVESAPVEPDGNTAAPAAVVDPMTTASLSIDETADLLFMREEEKLARDLYLALYQQWGTPAFQNIAASEQVHMDALLDLINQFGLQDPAAGNGPGVFSDPTLQDLYNDLINTGSQSLLDALLVGAAVEEIDILDLQGSLVQTSNSLIVPAYQNLLAGSENHLIAFVSSWERQIGESYQPQYLSQNEFAEIMASGIGGNGQGQDGRGQGGGQGRGGQGQGGQGQGGNGNRGQNGQGAGRGAAGSNFDSSRAGNSGRGPQLTAVN